jgi:putative transcriptional regulator
MTNNITTWREKANLTQIELATRCGWTSQSRISNYESGQRVPSLSHCRTIVAALNGAGAQCTFDDVFPPNESAA